MIGLWILAASIATAPPVLPSPAPSPAKPSPLAPSVAAVMALQLRPVPPPPRPDTPPALSSPEAERLFAIYMERLGQSGDPRSDASRNGGAR